jgi:hypothetical protein
MSELGQSARALLDAARQANGCTPTPAQAERLWARVSDAIAAPPPPAGAAPVGGAILAVTAAIAVAVAVVALVAPRAPAPVANAPPPIAAPAEQPTATAEPTVSAAVSAPPPTIAAPPATVSAPRAVRAGTPGDGRGDVALVRAAYQALRAGDATRSLTLLDEHARRFPASALAEERDATRVLALCNLGRTSDARAAFDRYTRAYPSGVQLKAFPSSCAP